MQRWGLQKAQGFRTYPEGKTDKIRPRIVRGAVLGFHGSDGKDEWLSQAGWGVGGLWREVSGQREGSGQLVSRRRR